MYGIRSNGKLGAVRLSQRGGAGPDRLHRHGGKLVATRTVAAPRGCAAAAVPSAVTAVELT